MTCTLRFTVRGALGAYEARVVEDGVAALLCGGWDVQVPTSTGEVHASCEPTAAAAKRKAREIVRRHEREVAARAFCEGLGGSWLKKRGEKKA